MAMTLRLTDDEARSLRRRAAHEATPLQKVARQASRNMSKATAALNC
jgi:hypothetical protein